MTNHKNAGRLVAALRGIIGKSQTQFAAMIGVSKDTIISVENGRNQLSRKLAEKIQVTTGADLWQETPGKPLNFTFQDFNKWRTKYYPSTEVAARKQFEEMNPWLKIVLLAAAKSGLAGNRDRLPAVCLSFQEWLNETRQHFRLADEIDDLAEDETRFVQRRAFSIKFLLEHPSEAKKRLAEHDIEFNSIRKHLRKNTFRTFLVVEDEFRQVLTSSGTPFPVVCGKRKILPRAKCWIKALPALPSALHDPDQMMKFIEEQPVQMAALLDEAESQDLLAMPLKTTRKSS